jgi:hypothetical protein
MCWLCFWFGIGGGRWLSEGEGKVKVEKMKDATIGRCCRVALVTRCSKIVKLKNHAIMMMLNNAKKIFYLGDTLVT